jgi:hypothetical protein
MTENQPETVAPARPANWKMILLRSAGFGGGFAIIAALLLGGIIWWSNRPKPWSENAITAKATELYTRQVERITLHSSDGFRFR